MSVVEAFKSTIPRIRDILRSGGITGMDSITHICLYVLSRSITLDRASLLGIPEEFAWENIMHMIRRENGGVEFAFESFISNNGNSLVDHFDRLFGTTKISFDLDDPLKHCQILKILDPIDINAVDDRMDVLGLVFEQHLGMGASASRDLGNFFTPRRVCEYMTELCAPKLLENGVPESVCDPTMGTGGFLTSFVKYYRRAYPETCIDWSEHQEKVHGCDTDAKISGVSRINFYLETRGARANNLLIRDSLCQGLMNTGYDVILAMPFGIKRVEYEKASERSRALKIPTSCADSLFMQLIMTSLNLGGRCAVVVPSGFLSNSTSAFMKTRRHLIENFNLRRVINLKGKIFPNTQIETSILFFENTGTATREVEFWNLEKLHGDVLTETLVNKRTIFEIRGKTGKYFFTLSVDEVSSPVCEEKDAIVTKTIGEIATIEGGGSINSEVAAKKGEQGYPIYGGGEAFKYLSPKHNRENRLVIAKGGVSARCVRWVQGPFFLSQGAWTLRCSPQVSERFLFYSLYFQQQKVFALATGSAQKSINRDSFNTFSLKLPPFDIQKKISDKLDSLFSDSSLLLEEVIHITDNAMDFVLGAHNCDHMEELISILRCKVSAKNLIDLTNNQMQNLFCSIMGVSNNAQNVKGTAKARYPILEIREIATIESGVVTNSEGAAKEGEQGYPIYGGGEAYKYLSPKHNRENRLVVAKGGVSRRCVRWVRGPFFLSQGAWTLRCSQQILERFLFYSLYFQQERVYALATGSAQKSINRDNFNTFRVIVPPIEVQEDIVRRLDALHAQKESLQTLISETEDNARCAIQSILAPREGVREILESDDITCTIPNNSLQDIAETSKVGGEEQISTKRASTARMDTKSQNSREGAVNMEEMNASPSRKAKSIVRPRAMTVKALTKIAQDSSASIIGNGVSDEPNSQTVEGEKKDKSAPRARAKTAKPPQVLEKTSPRESENAKAAPRARAKMSNRSSESSGRGQIARAKTARGASADSITAE